jgi:hypothetical protein
MKTYIVKSHDKDELARHGSITFEAQLLPIFGFESALTIEQVRNINGVESAEEERLGRLCV